MDQTTIKVPNELFAPAESSSYAGVYAPESLAAGPDVYTFADPLKWQVLVTNTGGALLVSGTVAGTGTTACSRCLEDVPVAIDGELEGYYLIDGEEGAVDEDEEEFDVLGSDSTIDLVPLLDAAILMDVPLQPLCRPDCAGICPDCGSNLNETSCDCASRRAQMDAEFEAAKNPFAVLRDIAFETESE